MTITTTNPVLSAPLRTADEAVEYFSASLAFHADVSDVQAALDGGSPGFVLVDSRGLAAWSLAHIPSAVHLPTAEIPTRARALLDRSVPVVTYCWGPGCNGATRAAFALAQQGYRVKEMLGGIEYWIREGFAVETPEGVTVRPADPLTAPVAGPVAAASAGSVAAPRCDC